MVQASRDELGLWGGGCLFLACLHVLLSPPTPVLTPLPPLLTGALFLVTRLKVCQQEAWSYFSAGAWGAAAREASETASPCGLA